MCMHNSTNTLLTKSWEEGKKGLALILINRRNATRKFDPYVLRTELNYLQVREDIILPSQSSPATGFVYIPYVSSFRISYWHWESMLCYRNSLCRTKTLLGFEPPHAFEFLPLNTFYFPQHRLLAIRLI